jgi:hypothetical protein
MKENKEVSQPSQQQYFSTPSQPNHPNIRTQPFSFSKVNQPPDGYISYNEFMRPCGVTPADNRSSQVSVSSGSIKKSNSTVEEVFSGKDLMMKKELSWQSGKQIMERPPGQPVFRQVTVRYL